MGKGRGVLGLTILGILRLKAFILRSPGPGVSDTGVHKLVYVLRPRLTRLGGPRPEGPRPDFSCDKKMFLKVHILLSKLMDTVYILQCLIEVVCSIHALSFGPCAGSLAAAALLRNLKDHLTQLYEQIINLLVDFLARI